MRARLSLLFLFLALAPRCLTSHEVTDELHNVRADTAALADSIDNGSKTREGGREGGREGRKEGGKSV